MRLEHLLKDILNFINRLLKWRQNPQEEKKKPFQSMRTVEGDYGVITLMEGRDTPRAVRSWIYSPKRVDLNSTRMVAKLPVYDDLHIHLDFLGPLPGVSTPKSQEEMLARQTQRKLGQQVNTHRLLILKASHFLNEKGLYDYELVFWSDYDFYMPMHLNPDQIARMLIDKLAYHCLQIIAPLRLEAADWDALVHDLWQEIRGRQFTRSSR